MALRALSTLNGIDTVLWHASELALADSNAVQPSDHPALDAQLPGGGWPIGGLCEILQARSGLHEWRLLSPALRALAAKVQPVARRSEVPQIVLAGAPYEPFGPGLAGQGLDVRALLWVRAETLTQRLWTAEQALRCTGVAAVLAWLPGVRSDHLRRLQLAAHDHAKLLFVLRPLEAQEASSPAVLRLRICPAQSLDDDAIRVQIIKRRGPPLLQPINLSTPPQPKSTCHSRIAARMTVERGRSDGAHALDRPAAAV